MFEEEKTLGIDEAKEPEIDEFDGWEEESISDDDWNDDNPVEAEEEPNDVGEVIDEEQQTETIPDTVKETNAEPEEVAAYWLETKYNKETHKFNLNDDNDKDTVVRLVQKGQNYDKVLTERDNLRNAENELNFIKNALESIKGEYATGYDLLDDALAEILVKSEAENGRVVDKDTAINRVRNNRLNSIKPIEVPDTKAIKQKSIEEFAMAYPNLDPQTIPQSVWTEFEETSDLITAYKSYENSKKEDEFASLKSELEKAKSELETLRLNEKNRNRSTGSRKTTGNPPLVDPDFEGWLD